MNTFEQTYNKAVSLLDSAVKKYKCGDVEQGEKLNEQANELFKNILTEKNNNIIKSNMLYGEDRNFGIIYAVLEHNIINKDKNANIKQALKECYYLIKNNNILSEQFKVYNAFTNHPLNENQNINDINNYVNEVLSIIKPLDKTAVQKANDKLISVLRKYNCNEMVELNDKQLELFESISQLLTRKQSSLNIKNITTATQNKQIIAESILSSLSNNTSVLNNYESEVNKLEEKYNSILTDDEKEFINEVTNSPNKEDLFNEYKNNLIQNIKSKLNEVTDDTLRAKWLLLNEKIENCKFNKKTYIIDIAKMIDIDNNIDHLT